MTQPYRYISGDSHLEIDSKVWLDRVPAKYRERAPRVLHLPDGSDAWLVEGQPLKENAADLYGGKGRDRWRPFGQNYATTPGTGSPQQRLREQDQDGVDAEVLFPGASGPRLWRSIKDDNAFKSVLRAYNDYLGEEYCAVAPDRLIGLGMLPSTGVDDAIGEMEHCAKLGLKGIALHAFPNGGGCPAPEDDRFWSAALDMQMPLTVHVEFNNRKGPLLKFPDAPKDVAARAGESRDFPSQLCKFARGGGINAVQILLDGTFDRFPNLKIFFAENQIGWLPLFFHMADVRYDRHSGWAQELLRWKPLKRLPSEYLLEHFYWGFQHDPVGPEMLNRLNLGRLIWASDFPHQDSDWPESLKIVEDNFKTVSDDERFAMVAGNVIEFFKLPAAYNRTPQEESLGQVPVSA
jgi:uncharacterized protein